MKKDAEKFLADLLNAPSPSGFEQPAAAVFRKRLEKHADEIIRDVHGNTLAVLNRDAPFKIMLAGHIDEIGLMVTHIDEKGFLYVAQVGGIDANLLIGQRVRIITSKGSVLGVVGRKAIHLMDPEERTKGVKITNLWVDIGASDKKRAEKVVAVGDPMVVDVDCRRMQNGTIISRGCDDKAGAFVVAETIRNLSGKKLNVCVVGVATVQEEVGHRGATTSAYNIKPDAGIAIDVGHASDYPESNPRVSGDVKLGKGPILHRGPNINPILEEDLFKAARRLKIPFQVTAEPRGTGTDANAIQLSRGGSAAALVSIPNRYMHSPVEVLSLDDLDAAVNLLTGYIEKLPAKRDFRP